MGALSDELDRLQTSGHKHGTAWLNRDCVFYGWLIQRFLLANPRPTVRYYEKTRALFGQSDAIPGIWWKTLVGTSSEDLFVAGLQWMDDAGYLSQAEDVNPREQGHASAGHYKLSEQAMREGDQVFGSDRYGYGISTTRSPDFVGGVEIGDRQKGISAVDLIMALNNDLVSLPASGEGTAEVGVADTIANILMRMLTAPGGKSLFTAKTVKKPPYVDGTILQGPNGWEMLLAAMPYPGTVSTAYFYAKLGQFTATFDRYLHKPWLLVYSTAEPAVEQSMYRVELLHGLRDHGVLLFLNLLAKEVERHSPERVAHLLPTLFGNDQDRSGNIPSTLLIGKLQARLQEEAQA